MIMIFLALVVALAILVYAYNLVGGKNMSANQAQRAAWNIATWIGYQVHCLLVFTGSNFGQFSQKHPFAGGSILVGTAFAAITFAFI